ncbi:hypothetical protein WICPIJ_007115 [Wickerhamomyces pijperi]|uniref:GABA-specific permease n=1 Tax=Wickerhamomyces pijperi TaxID=599730 RepID=A0A9P8TKA3_WICPI|nr:hypothetical protein WICPIJ_007115 [Wickerhamomyces pijperi]
MKPQTSPVVTATDHNLYSTFSNGLRSITSHALNTDPKGLNVKTIRNVHDHQIIDPTGLDDDELLAKSGYRKELKRHFTAINVFGVSFSIMSILPSIASVYGQSITTGPSSAIWGWFVSSFFIFLISVSMSELASANPTSGGLFYWTYYYAPDALKIPLSFVVGNSNTIALTGALCSIDYGFAKEVLAVVYIAKDGNFEITNGITYGVFAACVVSHVATACVASYGVAKLQTTSVIANLLLCALFIVAMLVGARHSFAPGHWVMTNATNLSDWPEGWSWVMNSFMPAIWTIGAFDSCIHMSEEAINATKTVPFGIMSSVFSVWIIGFFIMIVSCFALQPDQVDSVINAESGQPMAQLIYNTLGKKWSIAFMVLIAVCQWLMGASTITATSRQIWAFARDNGLVFSSIIKVVNSKLKVPIRAIIFGGIFALIMGLLCLIGTTAANALFTLYVCGNYFAWQTPIMLRLYNQYFTSENLFVPGTFYLGPILSPIVNVSAVLFTNFTIIMAMFPAGPTVDKESMNYTVVITCGTWLLSIIYFYAYARKSYFGPRNTISEVEGFSADEESASDSINGKEVNAIDELIAEKQ